jgi:hypothetical protein
MTHHLAFYAEHLACPGPMGCATSNSWMFEPVLTRQMLKKHIAGIPLTKGLPSPREESITLSRTATSKTHRLP